MTGQHRRTLRRTERLGDKLRHLLNTARLEMRATEPWQRARMTKWERRYVSIETRLACVERIAKEVSP